MRWLLHVIYLNENSKQMIIYIPLKRKIKIKITKSLLKEYI